MLRVWNWIRNLRVVEYRLVQEDRQRLDGLQFSYAAMTDEFQALFLELNALRSDLEGLAITTREKHGPKAPKEREHRPPRSPNHSGSSEGAV